ncbi:NHL repeat-containing protein [Mucilaginibacter aquatilis]|uniref:NHL repeat-containing protein n=1 Tax=Mucilaginibacter aquatilis TaxID=1517760 RepID=A0A6I4IAI5_9SPHI|nr:NHL repeat-containing protein [Mucilaginibacter aquatilis]MVN92230.1 hypothetical protein [Mucilaginibacter aquatilis]
MIFLQNSVIRNGLAAVCLAAAAIFTSCNKDGGDTTPVAPSVESLPVLANVTTTGAQSGGNVTNYGSNLIISSTGVCYSATNQTPTIADAKTSDGAAVNFKSIITGLTPNTTYYLRAYTQTEAGIGYGDVVTFKTSAAGADTTVTTSTLAGSSTLGNSNGTGASASFGNPQGVAVDAQGNVYVADSFNHLVRKVTPAGVTTTFAGSGGLGFAGGSAATAQFYSPQGITVDASSNVYVTDIGNNAVYKITQAGVVTILAGDGTAGASNGTGSAARFNVPYGITADAQGNLYVADRDNNRIRKITSAGVVTTYAGIGSASTPGSANGDATSAAAFYRPTGVAFDAQGNLFVVDQSNAYIRKITFAGVVSTYVGNSATKNLLNTPSGIAVDNQNNIYVTDQSGRILKVSAAKILYTLTGKTATAGFADGNKATALFSSPAGIAVDANKNIYVGDTNNNRIRKIIVQ